MLKAVVDAGGASADDDDDDDETARAVERARMLWRRNAARTRQQLVGWWLGALPFEEDDEEARRARRTLVNWSRTGDPALRARLPLVTARLAGSFYIGGVAVIDPADAARRRRSAPCRP